MKLYVVSGLGADFSVLSKIQFPSNLEIVHLEWLIPNRGESFSSYVRRFADLVDDSEPFCLLGYSFGGFIVQEIDHIKPAEKVIILGSLKSHSEKSALLKAGEKTKIAKLFPEKIYGDRSIQLYSFIRKKMNRRNAAVLHYFKVRDRYYLKWSIEKVTEWKFKHNNKTIQILGDRDHIFPIKNSRPDYVIKGGTHLFPVTKYKEVSRILAEIFQ